MTYLLDTTILIDLLRQDHKSWDFIDAHNEDKFITSSICEAEVWEGVYREMVHLAEKTDALNKLLQSLYKIVPFDSNQAQKAGQIRSTLRVKGESIGDLDVLIASCAVVNDATILTKNIKHFSRIKNLKILTL